jgi:hypothetical protein
MPIDQKQVYQFTYDGMIIFYILSKHEQQAA